RAGGTGALVRRGAVPGRADEGAAVEADGWAGEDAAGVPCDTRRGGGTGAGRGRQAAARQRTARFRERAAEGRYRRVFSARGVAPRARCVDGPEQGQGGLRD